MQEPAEPDALALALGADPVHAVVPVARAEERERVDADREARIERARAVLEEGRLVVGDHRLEERLVLALPQRRAVEERDPFVEDPQIGGDAEVLRRGVGQPDAIVADPGPHALARVREPPVLHVARGELPRRRAQQVFSREIGPRERERHPVLQLIAEAIGAARLVEGGTRPHPTGERLVEQPAIQHQVERAVGRAHLHGAEHVVPLFRHGGKHGVEIFTAVADDERARLAATRGFAEEDDDLGRAVRLDHQRGLERAARIETCAHATRERLVAAQRSRVRERAVAAEELDAIAAPRELSPGEIEERDALAEARPPGVAREQRAALRIDLGDDEGRRGAA